MKNILFIFLLIFLIGCAKGLDKNFNEIYINNSEKLIKINAEIADDNEERIKGLTFRERLNDDEGVLFVFENEEYQTFWMKNTLIPLDMIFIDEELKIVDIKNAIPCTNDPCQLYKSEAPAKYVLEVNGNFTKKNNIMPGNKVKIQSEVKSIDIYTTASTKRPWQNSNARNATRRCTRKASYKAAILSTKSIAATNAAKRK